MEESKVLKIAKEGGLGLVERENEEKAKGKKKSKWKKEWGRNHGKKEGNSNTKNREKQRDLGFGFVESGRNGLMFVCHMGVGGGK